MNCGSCGSPLPPGVAFCPNCGVATPYNSSPSGAASPYDPTIMSAPSYGAPYPQATSYGSQPYGTPPPPPPQAVNPYTNYAANPYEAPPLRQAPYGTLPPVAPMPKRRRRRWLILAIVFLVLILSVAAIFATFYEVNLNNQNAYATATAVAATYPFSSNLALNDPLSDNSKGYKWDVATYPSTGGACKFSGQAYHDVQTSQGFFNPCFASNTLFSNFTFQIEMVIQQGDAGGIIFRADKANNKYYYLRIRQNGLYSLFLYVDRTATNVRTLVNGTAASFAKGLNQTNLIAVVARGDTLAIYINKVRIAAISDTTYASGQIGVAAEDTTNSTEVVFTNAKIWLL